MTDDLDIIDKAEAPTEVVVVVETLYVTDAELIRRSGVPEKRMRALLQHWDASPGRSGFPQKVPLMGNRRCWSAVKAYLERINTVKIEAPANRGVPR